MNRATFVGNLGRDPQIRATNGGTTVATFSVGVTEKYNVNGEQKERTSWINVVAWGKLAEAVGNKLNKGSRVMVDGRIDTRSYTGKDGKTVYVTEVNAFTIAIPLDTRTGGNFEQYGQTQDEDIPF